MYEHPATETTLYPPLALVLSLAVLLAVASPKGPTLGPNPGLAPALVIRPSPGRMFGPGAVLEFFHFPPFLPPFPRFLSPCWGPPRRQW